MTIRHQDMSSPQRDVAALLTADWESSSTADFQGMVQALQARQGALRDADPPRWNTEPCANAERPYAELYEFAPVGFCTLDKDGTIVELNSTGVILLSSARDDLLGKRFADLLEVSDGERFQNQVCTTVHSSQGATFDIQLSHAHAARTLSLSVMASAALSTLGGRQQVNLAFTDTTARRRAEDGLRLLAEASDTLARSLDCQAASDHLAHLTVGRLAELCVVWTTQNDHIALASVRHADAAKQRRAEDTWLRLPLWDETRLMDELHTSSFPRIYPADAEDEGSAPPRFFVAMGIDVGVLLPIVGRFGTLGFAAFGRETHSPFTGPCIALLQSLVQRTAMAMDNARLYEQALAAARQREDAIAMVTHDLGNVLSGVSLSADLLLQRYFAKKLSETTLVASMERIKRSVTHGDGMLRDLLNVSQLEGGAMIYVKRPEAMMAMLREAVEGIQAQAQSAGVTVVLRPGMVRETFVLGERTRLLQVLANLLGNAVKFTPAGGAVEVFAELHADRLRVAVRDTGPGVTLEQQAHVFERYYRASRASPKRGTGLGLYISKSIVEAHGGKIGVISEPPDGSLFYFELPICDQAAHQEVSTTGGSGRHVLVVDHDEKARLSLCEVLEYAGYNVAATADGEAAMDYLRDTAALPSVVVLGWKKSPLGGEAFLQAKKGDPLLNKIPVVLIGTDESEAHAPYTRLSKPLRSWTLLKTLQNVQTAVDSAD